MHCQRAPKALVQLPCTFLTKRANKALVQFLLHTLQKRALKALVQAKKALKALALQTSPPQASTQRRVPRVANKWGDLLEEDTSKEDAKGLNEDDWVTTDEDEDESAAEVEAAEARKRRSNSIIDVRSELHQKRHPKLSPRKRSRKSFIEREWTEVRKALQEARLSSSRVVNGPLVAPSSTRVRIGPLSAQPLIASLMATLKR
jgi:hypothetical protein